MKIVLCLSGGGYRAALMHLGALRRLHELGILAHVDEVRAVSGGSIVAARLAATVDSWSGQLPEDTGARRERMALWDEQVSGPIKAFCGRDIRTPAILSGARPRRSIADALTAEYAALNAGLLADLPERPLFEFLATSVAYGDRWRFGRERHGSDLAGYWPASEFSIARAVAASSWFPPVFFPMRLPLVTSENRAEPPDYDHFVTTTRGNVKLRHALEGAARRRGDLSHDGWRREEHRLIEGLRLTDGGLYDNLGIGDPTALSPDDMLIVSDGGGPFGFSPAPGPRHQIKNLTRLNDIADTQARRLRRRILNERHAQHGNPSLIWAIDHPVTPEPRKASEGYTVRLVEAYIARMRTDLDAFSADEQSILENHGYSLAQDQLKRLTSREEWAIRAAAAVLPGGSADADFSWPGPHADYDESRAEELLRMMKSDERRSVWKAAGHAIGGFIKTALGRR